MPYDARNLVCDVSGHGISSALLANRIYAEVIGQIEAGGDLGPMLRRLNEFVLGHLGAFAWLERAVTGSPEWSTAERVASNHWVETQCAKSLVQAAGTRFPLLSDPSASSQ